MRYKNMLLVAIVCSPVYAEDAKSILNAPTSSLQPAGYRLIKDSGTTMLITSYQKIGKFYHLVHRTGKKSQLFETSVKSIEPLTEEEMEMVALIARESENKPIPQTSESPSSAKPETPHYRGRTKARSTARTKAKRYARTAPRLSPSRSQLVDPAPYDSFGSPGTTATGIPLHVGPRGGIYHYSPSGRNVYQRRN